MTKSMKDGSNSDICLSWLELGRTSTNSTSTLGSYHLVFPSFAIYPIRTLQYIYIWITVNCQIVKLSNCPNTCTHRSRSTSASYAYYESTLCLYHYLWWFHYLSTRTTTCRLLLLPFLLFRVCWWVIITCCCAPARRYQRTGGAGCWEQWSQRTWKEQCGCPWSRRESCRQEWF